jgi:hypothetical protein
MCLPLSSEQLEESVRQGDVSIAPSLAVHDVNDPASTVDVGDPKERALAEPEAARVDRGEARAVGVVPDCGQDTLHLLARQHRGESRLARGTRDLEHAPLSLQRLLEEELDPAERDRDRTACPALDVADVDEVGSDLILGEEVGGPTVVLRELADRSDVDLLRARGVSGELEVLGEALTETRQAASPGSRGDPSPGGVVYTTSGRIGDKAGRLNNPPQAD